MERWKRQPAHAPPVNPVAWYAISSPFWCVTQHFMAGYRVSAISISRGRSKNLKETVPSKTMVQTEKRNALALAPLPSTIASNIVISPGCWAARGPSPETRTLLLVCQDRRFWTTMMTPGPLLLVWSVLPTPLLSDPDV